MREGAHVSESAIEMPSGMSDSGDNRFGWITRRQFSRPNQACFDHEMDFVSRFAASHFQYTGRLCFCVFNDFVGQSKIHRSAFYQ
jgi:hypothetical protein